MRRWLIASPFAIGALGVIVLFSMLVKGESIYAPSKPMLCVPFALAFLVLIGCFVVVSNRQRWQLWLLVCSLPGIYVLSQVTLDAMWSDGLLTHRDSAVMDGRVYQLAGEWEIDHDYNNPPFDFDRYWGTLYQCDGIVLSCRVVAEFYMHGSSRLRVVGSTLQVVETDGTVVWSFRP